MRMLMFPCDFHGLYKYLPSSTCLFLRRLILETSVTNIMIFGDYILLLFNLPLSGLEYLQILKSDI